MLTRGAEIADGRYVLERHLGSGGMASVWLAGDRRLGRDVAIKLLSDMLAGDERYLARFHREARAAASLSHRNIVTVFDYGVHEERPYLVMAYVPGGSLRDRLQDGDPPDPHRLARELLGALAHVHAAGIVHRDVKPGNILLDDHGEAHLTDFGIARPDGATEMTQTGVVLGTVRYLAPEVSRGEPATEASDLYAAGCVLRDVGGDADLIAALTADDPAARPASAEAALRMLGEDTTSRTLPSDAPWKCTRLCATTVRGGSRPWQRSRPPRSSRRSPSCSRPAAHPTPPRSRPSQPR